MNAELEALIIALDAVIQAKSGAEAKALEMLYQCRVDDVLARHPNLSKESLVRAVDFAYRGWIRAQRKHSSPPPKA
jgi:hypothetical protein